MRGRTVVMLVVAMFLGLSAITWSQLGLRPYVVRTGSMSPTIQPGDAVLDVATQTHPRPGEVITFRPPADGFVTPRVHAVSGDVIRTKGDANRTADPWSVAPEQVVGTVRHTLPRVGYLLVYLQQPAGIGSLVTATVALFLAWQLFFGTGPVRPSAADPTTAA